MWSLQEQVERHEQNVDEHKVYIMKRQDCTDWLQEAQGALDQCAEVPSDQAALDRQLAIVKVTAQTKPARQICAKC